MVLASRLQQNEGNTKKEFHTKKTVTLDNTHLIWLAQTAKTKVKLLCVRGTVYGPNINNRVALPPNSKQLFI